MADAGDGDVDKRRINVKIFLEHMKQKFAKILDTICSDRNAAKDMVTVPEIRPLFELIIDPNTLKERKVSLVWLDETSIAQYNDPDVQKLIFFVPPTAKYVKLIKEFHNMLKRRNFDKKLYLVYYPKRTMMCKYYMDTQGMLVQFENSTFDFNFDLIPLYSDLLSLEYKPAVTEMFISNEYTCYNLVAESIQRLQMVFGKIPTFLIKGDKSKIVFEILKRLEKEHGNKLTYEEDVREIDAVIILDRGVDMLTPFLTQLSYQGIIDEFLDIEINKIVIDRSIPFPTGNDGPSEKQLKPFYLADPVFETIKDLSISSVGKSLREKLIEYQQLIQNRDLNTSNLKVLQEISKEIQKKKFVEPHVNIASYLYSFVTNKNFTNLECLQGVNLNADEFVESLLNLVLRKEDLFKVYRLLCIYSMAEGGFKAKHYEILKKEIIETYGFEQLNVFNHLSQANILYNRDTRKLKSAYNFFKKPQKLFNADYEKEEPNRKSFPYGPYTPLTVRVVEQAFRETWRTGGLVDQLPGYTEISGDARNAAEVKSTKKVVVLYMVGGITYAEISCMRYLAKQRNIELLIASTNIVNYKRMLEPFMQ